MSSTIPNFILAGLRRAADEHSTIVGKSTRKSITANKLKGLEKPRDTEGKPQLCACISLCLIQGFQTSSLLASDILRLRSEERLNSVFQIRKTMHRFSVPRKLLFQIGDR